MIERSVQRRALRGIGLWRSLGAEIHPASGGELSVPSCSEVGRSYRVALVGEGRCSCPDWRRRRAPCKHLYAAVVWSAKRRHAALQRSGSGRAA